jgi:hypothetical protein
MMIMASDGGDQRLCDPPTPVRVSFEVVGVAG